MKGKVSKYGKFRLKGTPTHSANENEAPACKQPSGVRRQPLALLSKNVVPLGGKASSSSSNLPFAKPDIATHLGEDTTLEKASTSKQKVSEIDQLGLIDEKEEEVDRLSSSDSSEAPSEYMTACSNLAPCVKPTEILLNDLYAVYDSDIYRYLRYRETLEEGRPRLNYMRKQSEVNLEMRAVLIDWFVDVCSEYVSLVDRTLSYVDCPRNKLQLLGTSALFLAAKMEEVYPPQLNEMVFITEETYDANQIKRMEKAVLRATHFDLIFPTAVDFAELFILHRPITQRTRCLIGYLLELSSLHEECLRSKPSQIAAAAFTIAVYISEERSAEEKEHPWTCSMAEKTAIRRDELTAVGMILLGLCRQAATNPLQAVYTKYCRRSQNRVAELVIPETAAELFKELEN